MQHATLFDFYRVVHVLCTIFLYQAIQHFVMRPKIDQRAGQLSPLHVGITKTEKVELKRRTGERINPVNGLEP